MQLIVSLRSLQQGQRSGEGASKGKSQLPSRLVRANPRISPCVLRFSSRANSIELRAQVTHLRLAKHRQRGGGRSEVKAQAEDSRRQGEARCRS